MKSASAVSISAAVMALALGAMMSPAQAALVSRNLDGNAATAEAYYDTVLGVSWLADANLAMTTTFGVANIGTQGGPGTMTRNTADAWIAGMNAQTYLGVSSWRLPHAVAEGGVGALFRSSGSPGEMASLYYTTLANSMNSATNAGPFSNLEVTNPQVGDLGYWTDPLVDTSGNYSDDPVAWFFQFKAGYEQYVTADSPYRVFAVTDGQIGTEVSAVPLPAAGWLFGSAFAGLMGMMRKRRRAASAS